MQMPMRSCVFAPKPRASVRSSGRVYANTLSGQLELSTHARARDINNNCIQIVCLLRIEFVVGIA